jgi:hypothetical protein
MAKKKASSKDIAEVRSGKGSARDKKEAGGMTTRPVKKGKSKKR